MTLSLVLACLWAVIASIVAMLPRRTHWPAAIGLIAVGIPLVGFVTYQNGPVWGMLVLAGGVSILRWPVIHLFRHLHRRAQAEEPAE